MLPTERWRVCTLLYHPLTAFIISFSRWIFTSLERRINRKFNSYCNFHFLYSKILLQIPIKFKILPTVGKSELPTIDNYKLPWICNSYLPIVIIIFLRLLSIFDNIHLILFFQGLAFTCFYFLKTFHSGNFGRYHWRSFWSFIGLFFILSLISKFDYTQSEFQNTKYIFFIIQY